MIKFDASGLQHAFNKLTQKLDEAVGESALRTAGFAGAEILRDEAKQNSLKHMKTGLLYNSIIAKRLVDESDGARRQAYLVTVRNGSGAGDGAFYWRFVEFGHKFVPRNSRVSAKTGKRTGWKAHRKAAQLEYGTASAPAYPFMRPAFDSHRQRAIDLMTKTLAEQIKRNLS